MTAALLLVVGVVAGWGARSVVIAKQNARRQWRAGVLLGLRQQQVMSEIAAQRRRSEEQMRRIVYQKGGQ
ncbi:hypothetical protein [Streptomyces shenzhenensis]|uniref:hypothetical protein n=1 Tax=Streptomyces shenzhenensis TaxID=943815 RepID=UPI001F2C9C64|nr:hypothetical protein [Streptomyces shenzhenensis]